MPKDTPFDGLLTKFQAMIMQTYVSYSSTGDDKDKVFWDLTQTAAHAGGPRSRLREPALLPRGEEHRVGRAFHQVVQREPRPFGDAAHDAPNVGDRWHAWPLAEIAGPVHLLVGGVHVPET